MLTQQFNDKLKLQKKSRSDVTWPCVHDLSHQDNFANESLNLIHRLPNPHILPHNEGNPQRNVGLRTAIRAMVVACDVFDLRAVGLL